MSIPYCAPAILKGIAESHGYKLKHYDTSVDLLNVYAKRDPTVYSRFSQYFLVANSDDRDIVSSFYEHVVEKIKKENFEYLGISVFSVYTHRAVLELLEKIKQELPDIKILVGGRGLTTKPLSHMASKSNKIITSAESFIDFEQILKKRKLADYFILGDGEDAIIEFLNKSSNKQTFKKTAKAKLEYPFSNFDDIDLKDYLGVGGKHQLPVVSSKGCVRSCDFCDVAKQMNKFNAKDGYFLAEEMIYLKEKYGISDFAMMDSISNGNMKELKRTCEKLSDYNKDRQDKISWSGSWIARFPNNIKSDVFDLIKKSGCDTLQVGAESGSNHVLTAMNKKSSVEGLYYELDHLYNKGIKVTMNTIMGHWSEELDHYLEHLQMLVNLGPYFASRTIVDLHANLFNLISGTPAELNHEENGIVNESAGYATLWYSHKNPSLTIKTRIARLLMFYDLIDLVGYPIDDYYERVLFYYNSITAGYEEWNDFFTKRIDTESFNECPSLTMLGQTDQLFQQMIKDSYTTSEFKLLVEAHSSLDAPKLQIYHNGTLQYEEFLIDGKNEIKLELVNDYTNSNTIEIKFANKNPNDTIVDEQGNIISDKKILFNSIMIDKVDLFKDANYFYNKTSYVENEKKLEHSKPGLYHPSALIIKYNAPFWQHYLLQGPDYTAWKTTNNVDLAKSLRKELTKKLNLLKY